MFTGLLNLLRSIAGLFLPSVEEAGARAKRSRVLRGVLHLLLVAAILAGLWYVNKALKIDDLIPNPRYLAPFWLPGLFLIVYLMIWVAWWLWKLVVSEDEAGTYPDIEAAWNEAVLALNRKGLYLNDLPLFLFLGQPSGNERALFQAAKVTLKLEQTPARGSPLHVYASEQAIFVTCPGLSLLACQARNLAKSMDTSEFYAWSPQSGPGGEDGVGSTTLRSDEAPTFAQDVKHLARRLEQAGRSMGDMGEDQRRDLNRLEREDRPYLSLPNRPELVDEHSRRLQHLCRLIARDRHPLCPANGILLLVPVAATASSQQAADTEHLCRRDLKTVRDSLRLLCPRIVMLCDMETVPGFRDFIAGFSREKRLSRMGQGCPLAPDFVYSTQTLSPEKLAESLASWVCRNNIPTFIYKEFALEDSPAKTNGVLEKNIQIYSFLDQLRDRDKHLGRILSHGVVKGSPDPLMFGGCYLAGTGNDGSEQAFVRGVVDWLREHQDDVCWTEEVRRLESWYDRLTSVLNTIAGVVVVLALVVIGYSLFGHFVKK